MTQALSTPEAETRVETPVSSGLAVHPAGRVPTPVLVGVHPGEEDPDWEELAAAATTHVIAAYRDLEKVRPALLGSEGSSLFELVCHYLCGTLVALDQLADTVWLDEATRDR